MTRYAILLGSAPKDFRQKKIEDMFDFLEAVNPENRSGIVTFPNGISEIMLELVLENSLKQNPDGIFLYVCTRTPVSDGGKSVWLGGDEIRRSVIEHYKTLSLELGVDFQVVLDWDSETVSEEELGYE